jgi:hypothetical protein
MMKLVNHASSEIHRIYRRVTIGDAARYVDLVPIPAIAAVKLETLTEKSCSHELT